MIEVAGIKLYTFEELAEQMNITVHTLHEYRKNRKLNAKIIGGRWMVSEDNLRQFGVFCISPKKVYFRIIHSGSV